MYYRTSTLCQVLNKKFLAIGVHEARRPLRARPARMGHPLFLILSASGSDFGNLEDQVVDDAVRLVDVAESAIAKTA